MKIIGRKEFLKLPKNTLYSKYTPCCFGELEIKSDNSGKNDWYVQYLNSAIEFENSGDFIDKLESSRENNIELSIDLKCESRDGLYDEDQLFAVWSKKDVKTLIERLTECL